MSTPTLSRRMRRSVIPVAAIAVIGAAAGGAVLSGCGSTASAGSAPASIAGYIPADSPLYVQVSTDTQGSQWSKLIELGTLYPGFGDMRADLDRSLSREGIDWEKDLRPLLGDAAAMAVTEVPDTASVTKGALADPAGAVGRAAAEAADQPMLAVLQVAQGKAQDLKALIAKGNAGLKETGTRDGATLYADPAAGTYAAVTEESLIIGDTQAVVDKALEAHAAGGEAVLSGVFRFNEALALLPKDVFAMGYVNLATVGETAAGLVPQVQDAVGGEITGAAAMSVTAEDGGLRLKAVMVDAPKTAEQQSFSPSLTAQAPADAIAYVGFNRLADTVERAVTAASDQSSEETRKQLDTITKQFPLLLGVDAADLRNLTGGEHAVVVTADGAKPQAALALKVADGAQASRSLTALSRSIPVVVNQFGGSDAKISKATAISQGAVKGQRLSVDGRVIAWGVRDDLAALGTGVPAIAGVLAPRAAADSLAGSPSFTAATAGIPDQVTGLAYVNVRRAVPLMAANGAFEGKDGARKRADIAPIRDITAWSTAGENPTVEVFVGMGK